MDFSLHHRKVATWVNYMVQDAPTWVEVWPKVKNILQGRFIGIYNADFDLRMMYQSHAAHGLSYSSNMFFPFCIMRLYSQYRNIGRWISLERAGLECGIPLPNSHRSLADTLLARELLHYMAND